MKKLYLLLICLFCLMLPCGAAAEQTVSFQYYQNARFSYSLIYLDFFTQIHSSDNGDGLTFTEHSGKYTLKVWGQNNINNLTAQGRLAQIAEYEITHIRDSGAQDGIYWVLWSDDGGKDGQETLFYEYGRVLPDRVAVFQFSFPEAQSGRLRPLIDREMQLNFLMENRDYLDMVFALAQSQIRHYDSFGKNREPDWQTLNNVLYTLVAGRHIGSGYTLVLSETDESVKSIHFREDGPKEGQEETGNTTPNELYQAYFTTGQYKYPENDYPFVKATQPGMMMDYTAEQESPAIVAKFLVLEEKDADNQKHLRITLKRMDYDNNTETGIGEATVILQKDPDAYFGWTILSYTPDYPVFADFSR